MWRGIRDLPHDTTQNPCTINGSPAPPPEATKGGASFAEGRARSPPRPSRQRFRLGGRAALFVRCRFEGLGRPPNRPPRKSRKGGSPVQPLQGGSRYEYTEPGAVLSPRTDPCTWIAFVADRVSGEGAHKTNYIRETGQPRSGWYPFRGGVPQQPDCQWQCLHRDLVLSRL